jgi:gliding motility-associated-like protein
VTFDTNACAGLPIFFHDKVSYHTDSTEYWRIGTRRIDGRESYQWDFGDGGGFTKNEAVPFHVYKKPGIYNARLVTKDSLDCHDTLYFDVKIRGIRAAIKTLKSVYLCAEIVQFFDSSFLIDPFPGDRIVRRIWDFGDGSQLSYLENPFHYYSSFGTFTVRLIVMNLKGCTDTAYTKITIEGPTPRFSFASDSVGCVPLRVELKNESSNVNNWIWYFGDDNNTIFTTDSSKNVSFTYTKPGVYYLKLFGADSVFNAATGNMQFCSSTWPDYDKPSSEIKRVIVLPYPPADFNLKDSVCVDELFVVVNASDPKYKTFVWDFGDSIKTTTGPVSTHSYARPGTYPIVLRPEYPLDSTGKFCFDSARKQIVVTDVEALFVVDSLRSKHSVFCFTNFSRNGFRYEWDFGQPSAGARNQSTLKDPCHNYIPYKGIYTVCLDAYNSLGCVDRHCLEVENLIEQRLQIPNIFTPGNTDGFNDAFDIDIEAEQEYDLQIFNRWGQLVYQSTDDGQGNDGINWNGNNLQNGEPCPAGVYYVVFRYKFYFEDTQQYQGTVTLIRD